MPARPASSLGSDNESPPRFVSSNFQCIFFVVHIPRDKRKPLRLRHARSPPASSSRRRRIRHAHSGILFFSATRKPTFRSASPAVSAILSTVVPLSLYGRPSFCFCRSRPYKPASSPSPLPFAASANQTQPQQCTRRPRRRRPAAATHAKRRWTSTGHSERSRRWVEGDANDCRFPCR